MQKNTIFVSDLKFFKEQPLTALAANVFRVCIIFFPLLSVNVKMKYSCLLKVSSYETFIRLCIFNEILENNKLSFPLTFWIIDVHIAADSSLV
jgi:hypothetical protein